MVGEAIDMTNQSNGSAARRRSVTCGGTQLEIDALTPDDATALAAFVATLPAHDLLFLRRDISHPKVIAAWMDALRDGRLVSLAARAGGAIVGCSAIVIDELSWSRHVGELRVLVGPALRGTGLGRELIQQSFAQALELGLAKLCAQMTIDQQSAIGLFEELGFRAEALLRKHVKDRDGRLHDLALLSHDVAAVNATLHAYGISEVFDPAVQGGP